jgi:drug/metabolite transporter (DMT)-like permease
MSLVNASAWFDAISALGYFTAFAFFGEHISGLQWLGIALLITGLYLINL